MSEMFNKREYVYGLLVFSGFPVNRIGLAALFGVVKRIVLYAKVRATRCDAGGGLIFFITGSNIIFECKPEPPPNAGSLAQEKSDDSTSNNRTRIIETHL
jgi:hypothetical protein